MKKDEQIFETQDTWFNIEDQQPYIGQKIAYQTADHESSEASEDTYNGDNIQTVIRWLPIERYNKIVEATLEKYA